MRNTRPPSERCWSLPALIQPALIVALLLAPLASLAEVEDVGTSVEGCIGCHAEGGAAPVGDISDTADLHYIDLDPLGPATASGYRQLNVTLNSVDVSGANIVIDFRVSDENDADVDNIFDSDGRFVLARLVDGVDPNDPDTFGNPTDWDRLAQESFSSTRFEFLGGGAYRYTTAFDPTSVPVMAGETLRGAVEISASDIPAGNGWCDFDANLSGPNDCVSPTTLTRDIVQTATCNDCHGATSDTHLEFHGNGGRTQVEYCVTCHNPGRNPDTSMTNMTHKIHFGSDLTQEWRGGAFDHVTFTKDIDNCTNCHNGNGVDVDNWMTEPYRSSCGSCHDDVNFDTGEGHGSGGQQPTNRFCSNCHPPTGELDGSQFPVATVHQGVARAAEADSYRGDGNGFAIESLSYDRSQETLTVDFSVTRNGQKMALQSDPRWTNGGRLVLSVAWSTEEYTNEGSNTSPAPAQPIAFNALDIGNTVTDLQNGSYRTVIDISSFGFGNLTVGMDGHPSGQVLEGGPFVRIPVRSAFASVNVEKRQPLALRRDVIDIAKCNDCHDASGAGLAFHGDNRTDEMQVCVLCHNPDVTDIAQRPSDPAMTPDGKREEAVDIKRMIHQIHRGKDLVDGLVIYGFGGRPHDYSHVGFTGNNRNCETCHIPGTYSTEAAWEALATTIDTGEEVTDPSDDLNISQTTSVCSSCHDTQRAKDHMVLNGGSFGALDSEIAIAAVPEPGGLPLWLAALVATAALARRRRGTHDSIRGHCRIER